MESLLDTPTAVLSIGAVAALVVLLGRRVSIHIGPWSAELRPNGGRSMKDRMDRTDLNVYAIHRNMLVIAEHVGIDTSSFEAVTAPPESQPATPPVTPA